MPRAIDGDSCCTLSRTRALPWCRFAVRGGLRGARIRFDRITVRTAPPELPDRKSALRNVWSIDSRLYPARNAVKVDGVHDASTSVFFRVKLNGLVPPSLKAATDVSYFTVLATLNTGV